MMLHMTPRIGSAFAAAAILGAALLILPSTAMAQASPAPATAAPAPAAKAAPVDRVETRIKSLHHTLRITADQEQLWQAVADTMRDNAKTIRALIAERAANAKTMTAVDDLHTYAAIADAHAAGVNKLATAFEALYASFSDAQKKRADAEFRRQAMPTRPKKAG